MYHGYAIPVSAEAHCTLQVAQLGQTRRERRAHGGVNDAQLAAGQGKGERRKKSGSEFSYHTIHTQPPQHTSNHHDVHPAHSRLFSQICAWIIMLPATNQRIPPTAACAVDTRRRRTYRWISPLPSDTLRHHSRVQTACRTYFPPHVLVW
jgi:hypothetical protein